MTNYQSPNSLVSTENVFKKQYLISSPLGVIQLEWGTCGLMRVSFPSSKRNRVVVSRSKKERVPKFLQFTHQWFDHYFNNRPHQLFPLEFLDLSCGTPFQKAVWDILWKIPFGEVRSYGWVASRLNNKGASRAVGQANKRNLFPIIIPCHRVIASDGSIGGYSGGIGIKRKLLRVEGICL